MGNAPVNAPTEEAANQLECHTAPRSQRLQRRAPHLRLAATAPPGTGEHTSWGAASYHTGLLDDDAYGDANRGLFALAPFSNGSWQSGGSGHISHGDVYSLEAHGEAVSLCRGYDGIPEVSNTFGLTCGSCDGGSTTPSPPPSPLALAQLSTCEPERLTTHFRKRPILPTRDREIRIRQRPRKTPLSSSSARRIERREDDIICAPRLRSGEMHPPLPQQAARRLPGLRAFDSANAEAPPWRRPTLRIRLKDRTPSPPDERLKHGEPSRPVEQSRSVRGLAVSAKREPTMPPLVLQTMHVPRAVPFIAARPQESKYHALTSPPPPSPLVARHTSHQPASRVDTEREFEQETELQSELESELEPDLSPWMRSRTPSPPPSTSSWDAEEVQRLALDHVGATMNNVTNPIDGILTPSSARLPRAAQRREHSPATAATLPTSWRIHWGVPTPKQLIRQYRRQQRRMQTDDKWLRDRARVRLALQPHSPPTQNADDEGEDDEDKDEQDAFARERNAHGSSTRKQNLLPTVSPRPPSVQPSKVLEMTPLKKVTPPRHSGALPAVVSPGLKQRRELRGEVTSMRSPVPPLASPPQQGRRATTVVSIKENVPST